MIINSLFPFKTLMHQTKGACMVFAKNLTSFFSNWFLLLSIILMSEIRLADNLKNYYLKAAKQFTKWIPKKRTMHFWSLHITFCPIFDCDNHFSSCLRWFVDSKPDTTSFQPFFRFLCLNMTYYFRNWIRISVEMKCILFCQRLTLTKMARSNLTNIFK